jgi:hypothetical protein
MNFSPGYVNFFHRRPLARRMGALLQLSGQHFLERRAGIAPRA